LVPGEESAELGVTLSTGFPLPPEVDGLKGFFPVDDVEEPEVLKGLSLFVVVWLCESVFVLLVVLRGGGDGRLI
jgi:hypothetical protein